MSPAAEMLEALRVGRHLSQATLARLVDLPPSFVSGLLNGKVHIPKHPEFVDQVADGLGLSASDVSILHSAISVSPRSLSLSPSADREMFLLVAALRDYLPVLGGDGAHCVRQLVEFCGVCMKTGVEVHVTRDTAERNSTAFENKSA